MTYRQWIWLCLVLIWFAPPVHAGEFRCGQDLVGEGDMASEVLERCGEPTHRDGYYWIYDRGDAGKTTLRVVDDRVTDIAAGDPF